MREVAKILLACFRHSAKVNLSILSVLWSLSISPKETWVFWDKRISHFPSHSCCPKVMLHAYPGESTLNLKEIWSSHLSTSFWVRKLGPALGSQTLSAFPWLLLLTETKTETQTQSTVISKTQLVSQVSSHLRQSMSFSKLLYLPFVFSHFCLQWQQQNSCLHLCQKFYLIDTPHSPESFLWICAGSFSVGAFKVSVMVLILVQQKTLWRILGHSDGWGMDY